MHNKLVFWEIGGTIKLLKNYDTFVLFQEIESF